MTPKLSRRNVGCRNASNPVATPQKRTSRTSGSAWASKTSSRAQNRICGYCGAHVSTDDIQLDHFRPKAEVTREILSAGQETPGLVNMEGRRLLPQKGIQPAWWWLAYEWDNFVAACAVCNKKWKRTLFPARNATYEPPREHEQDDPLLLNPFDLADPLEHFDYDELGAIGERTDQGKATIETCGLDRPSLVQERFNTLKPCLDVLEDLRRPDLPKDYREDLKGRIRCMGAWDRPFASAVRALTSRAGWTWDTEPRSHITPDTP